MLHNAKLFLCKKCLYAMLQEHEFEKLCQLSRLRIDAKDKDSFIQRLSEIFAWIDQLQEIDVSNVKLDIKEACDKHERSDDSCECDSNDDILSNTTNKKFNMFAVPKVVE